MLTGRPTTSAPTSPLVDGRQQPLGVLGELAPLDRADRRGERPGPVGDRQADRPVADVKAKQPPPPSVPGQAVGRGSTERHRRGGSRDGGAGQDARPAYAPAAHLSRPRSHVGSGCSAAETRRLPPTATPDGHPPTVVIATGASARTGPWIRRRRSRRAIAVGFPSGQPDLRPRPDAAAAFAGPRGR